MSFVCLDSSEFPPLGQAINQSNKSGNAQSTISNQNKLHHQHCDSQSETTRNPSDPLDSQCYTQRSDVDCRIGIRFKEFTNELDRVLDELDERGLADFVMVPIEPERQAPYTDKFQILPDLVISNERWQTQVVLEVAHHYLDHYHTQTAQHFDHLFRHALYLDCSIIVVTCPESDPSILSVASTVNDRLSECVNLPKILFKYPIPNPDQQINLSSWMYDASFETLNDTNSDKNKSIQYSNVVESESAPVDTVWSSESGCDSYTDSRNSSQNLTSNAWVQWNNLRSHLNPDPRIGVCLFVNDNLATDSEDLSRWTGEPIRIVILASDQFIKNTDNTSNKLQLKCRDFIEKILKANSFKIQFVIEPGERDDIHELFVTLTHTIDQIKNANPDFLRPWNDKMRPPLQPLSSNLDSGTYGVFETDSVKYKSYQRAMVKAITQSITNSHEHRIFNLMVLGAGRGPLVDSMIAAIDSLKPNRIKFNIYALDKNPSSVRSLMFKQQTKWNKHSKNIKTHVIHSDMRTWNPGLKADVIASELLGSFSDNELSPECIDGTWRLATQSTISIPQQYTSYLAPICSYRLFQELYKLKNQERDRLVYDQIYVVRLSNFYLISTPQPLFTFQHQDLTMPPEERHNERYVKLTFWSKVDTVCHGFAGYFTAQLFGDVNISTLLGNETPKMHSWFPAFVPLDSPIEMARNSKLEVHFWRKESTSSIWYQWAITSPVRTRLYSQNGHSTSMSKFI